MKNRLAKRFCAVLLVLAMLMAGSALAACQANITASSLNVRAGVGTGYQVLQALPRNTAVYYLGVSDVDNSGDIWYKVQYGVYGTGWVSAKYCQLNESYTVTSYAKAETGSTNIRSNPHLEGSKLGVMSKGTTATYLNQVCTDTRGVDWYYVNYNGTIGWISSKYSNLYAQSVPSLSIMPTLPAYGATSGTLKVEGGNAYIRDAANLNGRQLAVLHVGESASYLNERSVDERGVVWFKVNYNGTTGWISSKYAMIYGNAPSSAPIMNYIRATGKCNVRKQPSLDAGSYGVMQKDAVARYRNETAIDNRGVIWYKVEYEGYTGWVSSKYGVPTNTIPGFSLPSQYAKATGKTNVRTEPNLDGRILGTLQKGETAVFNGSTSTDNRGVVWYSIRFEGTNGWVSSKYTVIQ